MFAFTSMVFALMRLAMKRSRSGLIVRSSVEMAILPEAIETIATQLSVAHRVLDVSTAAFEYRRRRSPA
jgi:hypothetical protein